MAALRGRALNPNQILTRNPTIPLGSYEFDKITGAVFTSTLTANSIRTLSPGVVEQDIVTRRDGRRASGRPSTGYAEIICRFRQIGPDTQFVQVAKIAYAADRTIVRRLLLEGTLARNWQPYAAAISRQLNRPWQQIAQRHDI